MTGRRKTSGDDAAKRLKQMFGDASPGHQLTLDALDKPDREATAKSDRTEQLNARVPVGHRKRVRLLAARDGLTVSEVVVRAIALYEEKYGAAPGL